MVENDAKSRLKHRELREALGDRSIVMVGLMGCGKSSVGRRLANVLDLPFIDADDEIETAAGKSISEIFADYGEAHFRDREWRIIDRILRSGPMVLATGGGAFMRAETRASIRAAGFSVWLKAELPVLMNRVMRRDNRPLLKTVNPEQKMRLLIEERYPVYAQADITVESRDASHEVVVQAILRSLKSKLHADG
ncbi:MAG: shikimate kinase [Hyphomicrobiaceae bacterium]